MTPFGLSLSRHQQYANSALADSHFFESFGCHSSLLCDGESTVLQGH